MKAFQWLHFYSYIKKQYYVKCEATPNQLIHKTLNNLLKNSSIVICKMNKGNWVVF